MQNYKILEGRLTVGSTSVNLSNNDIYLSELSPISDSEVIKLNNKEITVTNNGTFDEKVTLTLNKTQLRSTQTQAATVKDGSSYVTVTKSSCTASANITSCMVGTNKCCKGNVGMVENRITLTPSNTNYVPVSYEWIWG